MSYISRNILTRGTFLIICCFAAAYIAQFQLLPALVLISVALVFAPNFFNFLQGGHGELDVAGVLDELPSEYEVLGDVNLKNRGNIDYVVIGPSGVWTIEVKSHSGRIGFVNGKLVRQGRSLNSDFIKQAHAQMYAVKDRIRDRLGREMFVQPIIVFSSQKARLRFGLRKQKGVYVIGKTWLADLLTGGYTRLSASQIENIRGALVG